MNYSQTVKKGTDAISEMEQELIQAREQLWTSIQKDVSELEVYEAITEIREVVE